MYSHMQRRPVTDCRCTSQNYKEPFRFMLGTQVLIGRHIRSRSLAWLYYGPNFVGSFSDFFQGGTNVSLLSRSFIVQFLSLLSAWLSSRSVSLISETFFGQNFARVSLRIFVRVVLCIYNKLHSHTEILSWWAFDIIFSSIQPSEVQSVSFECELNGRNLHSK